MYWFPQLGKRQIMRGDFSGWNKDGVQNFRGTLHQQGRVLLDRDWNAQTEILLAWQQAAGRDAFGTGVAAVPAELAQSFKVTEATVDAGVVKISANKGRLWLDGLLVESAQDILNRVATYLNRPASTLPNPSTAPLDIVILETWLEELSAFQVPASLIEPALGDVDTTERVQMAYRFRLFRMQDGDTSDSIIPTLQDDFSSKGKLTVTLSPNAAIDGDFPIVEGGGYTGFENCLYRIEIAQTAKAGSWFKWSQFNGGLVGTGDFDSVNRKVAIHGNRTAIVHSGLNQFYLEALDLDESQGFWRVIYAAKASLRSDNILMLPPAGDAREFFGSVPPATGKRFFRLWNGIEPIADYVAADKELPDLLGIRLKFDTGAVDKHAPSDFWTFKVHSGEIGNPPVLIGDPTTLAGYPPQGIQYDRVPLAKVRWAGNDVTGGDIEDCRRVFQPLTKLNTCYMDPASDSVCSPGRTEIQLTQQAERLEICNQVSVRLDVEASGNNALHIQLEINKRMSSAIARARSIPSIKVETGSYSVSRPYNSQSERESDYWCGLQTLSLISDDFDTVLKVVGELQDDGLLMKDMRFFVAPETLKAAQDELTTAALRMLNERASHIANDLGRRIERFKNITIGNASEESGDTTHRIKESVAGVAVTTAPSAIASGYALVTLQVNATVILAQ
jgi:predicted secreted protein